jgi:hypothetical protein
MSQVSRVSQESQVSRESRVSQASIDKRGEMTHYASVALKTERKQISNISILMS